MTRRTNVPSTVALALAVGLSWAPGAFAQDGESGEDGDAQSEAIRTETDAERDDPRGKISDRIKAVQRKVFLKKKRIEIFPQFGLGLNDPFFQHFVVGGAVGFHVADSLSIELRGGGVVASVQSDAVRFVRQETGSLLKDPPQFRYHADIDVLWAPLYGKISLFGEGILHFDTYVTAGPGVFGTDQGINPAVNVGIGQRYFLTDWLVARLEVRNYMFVESRNNQSDLQNVLILGFALSGFLPTSFQYEFQ